MTTNFKTDETWTSTGHESKAFRGLFTNPDYDHPDIFLQQDEQTRLTRRVRELAALINDSKDITTLAEIYAVSHKVAPYHRPSEYPPLFTNAASDILSRGYATGCTDYAVAFASLARAKGIPAIVVDSASLKWVQDGASLESVTGHFFVEAFLKERWQLVDATTGKLYDDYKPENQCLLADFGPMVAFAKGLSVIDMGVDDFNHNLLQRIAFLEGETSYSDPGYQIRNIKDKNSIVGSEGRPLLNREFLSNLNNLQTPAVSCTHRADFSRNGKKFFITAKQAEQARVKALSLGASRAPENPAEHQKSLALYRPVIPQQSNGKLTFP